MSSQAGRKCANWDADPTTQVAKMVAWLVFDHMGGRSSGTHLRLYAERLPLLTEEILGKRVTLEGLRLHFKETQDREITDNAIFQRGDKAARYSEYNLYKHVVADAWLRLGQEQQQLDARRAFCDEVVRAKIEEQGGACGYCGRPFTDQVLPVGDHCLPWSLGGRTEMGNCVAACVGCNSDKRDMLPHVFMRQLLARLGRGRKL